MAFVSFVAQPAFEPPTTEILVNSLKPLTTLYCFHNLKISYAVGY